MAELGRPTSYTPEIAAIICQRIALGESLRSICRDEGMPPAPTVCEWAISNRQGFSEQYAQAREIGLDLMAMETIEIADTPQIGEKRKIDADGKVEVTTGDMIEHRRLRVDTRKWYLSKLAPKRYGEQRPEAAVASSNFQVLVLSAGQSLPATIAPNGSGGFVIEE
jgi:hypothetical protein